MDVSSDFYEDVVNIILGSVDDNFVEQDENDIDLQLAAQLGKILLERNRDLENKLIQTQLLQSEQAREIEFLTKRVEVLRAVNENRMRIYEDLDRNIQELERVNTELHEEIKKDKDHIEKLNNNITNLEGKNSILQSKVTKIADLNKSLQIKRELKKDLKGGNSLIPTDNHFPVNGYDSGLIIDLEFKELKIYLQGLKYRLSREKRKNQYLIKEVKNMLKEQKEHEIMITKLRDEQKNIEKLKAELEIAEIESNKSTAVCNCDNINKNILCSIPEQETMNEVINPEVMKLTCGGKAYANREYLFKEGLAVTTDNKENVNTKSKSVLDIDPNHISKELASLFDEMKSLYNGVLKKYDTSNKVKIDSKPCNDPTFYNGPISLRNNSHFDLEIKPNMRNASKLYGRNFYAKSKNSYNQNNKPPEYQKLFKEIFSLIKVPGKLYC